ncbi:MAG: succinate dehydrogenase assembly factor 2 [Pseudorhodoplanes sp.]
MSGSIRSSEGLSERRRRLLFRSWHRGIRETDLILGRFADAHIGELTEAELDDYERLLEVPDHDIYGWVTGERDIPPDYQGGLLSRIAVFHAEGGGGR